MIYRLEIGNQSHKIEILKNKTGKILEILVDDQKFIASELNFIKDINLVKQDNSIIVKTENESFEISLRNIEISDTKESEDSRHIEQMREFFKEGKLISPLPGKIVDIRCKENTIVEKGKIIVALEAMKMENEIITPFKIKVTKVLVSISDSVLDKQILLEYDLIQ